MTTKQAGEFLGVSTKTVKRWRVSGKLNPAKIEENGYCLYSLDQLGTLKNELGTKVGTQTRDTDSKTRDNDTESRDNKNMDTKKTTDDSADQKKYNSYSDDNTNFSVLQNNLPTEISRLKRFIPVRDDGKTPHGAGWQNAENQKFLKDIHTKNAAFFIGTDYLALDFDNVLDAEGKFTNARAEDF